MNLSVFKKVMIVFVLIVAVVHLVALQIIRVAKQDLLERNSEAVCSSVELAFNMYEADLSDILDQQGNIISDVGLNRLVSEPTLLRTYDGIETVNRIAEQISRIVYNSKLVSSVSLFLPTLEKTVTNEAKLEFHWERFLPLIERVYAETSSIFAIGDRVYMNIMTPFQHYYERGMRIPFSDILVELSSARILQHFNEFFHAEGMSYALFLNGARLFSDSTSAKAGTFAHRYAQLTANSGAAGRPRVQVDRGSGSYYYGVSSPRLGIGFLLQVRSSCFSELIAQYNYFFLLLTVVVLVVIAAFFRIIKYLVNEPMQRMIGAFERVNRGALDLQLEYHRHDDFRYLYDGFNRMINRIHLLITQVYEQRILAQEATLKQLQYQISPHFLYNTLSVLYQTIKFGDDDKALHMARGLNEYYRYVVKNTDSLVTLESEMEHVRNYVDIQGMRYGDRITVALDEVPESLRSFKVPILIVQPVVENAYKHGLKDVEDHGMIRVSIADSESRVEISVEDNGESLSRTQLADLRRQMDSPVMGIDRTGLMNVHRRLRIKYGTESGVGLSRSALGGLRVMLHFQKEQL